MDRGCIQNDVLNRIKEKYTEYIILKYKVTAISGYTGIWKKLRHISTNGKFCHILYPQI